MAPGTLGNIARMKAPLLMLAALLVLPGCSFFNPVPAGTVTGLVLYNGEPAAGKRVSLIGSDKKVTTDANGRYTFTGVQAGAKVYVNYVSAFDRPTASAEDPSLPNEVSLWQSAAFQVDGSGGREVPAFDVAYNGLLYPDKGMSLIVKPDSPVPFHWSTHPQAQHYRVKVLVLNTGENIFTGEWVSDPTAIFAKAVAPGSYRWQVEIDAGDRGTGLSRPRAVDF